MAGKIRFVILLHSHQPVGNFDHVMEEAYQKSYLPFIKGFEEFPEIPLTLHYSGCLLEWLEQKHPEYFERIAAHTGKAKKQAPGKPWEMIGGGMQEPILTLLHERDRQGQIHMMADYVKKHFGAKPRGGWLTERVWEPALASTLGDAGVEYITLDDTHFKAAGFTEDQLGGCYLAEDQGRYTRVYPASEKLRYLIPYAPVHEVINYLKSQIPAEGERILVYADDGEKFGVWPKTYEHCFRDGWLKNFLGALKHEQQHGWIEVNTLAEANDKLHPLGFAYLPENSYREMTEWALPAKALAAFEKAWDSCKDDPRLKDVLPLLKGGNWRSFRVKYPEGMRMYAKMMEISEKVSKLDPEAKLTEKARNSLYRGQCNCPYWHGVFGGMYLPHLRSAIFSELIKAEKLADEMGDGPDACIEKDFDCDGEKEVKLANAKLALYLHPKRGGHLYEFDVRDAHFNVLDTFARRYEAYHDKVKEAKTEFDNTAGSIHGMVRAKEMGLEKLLKYDTYLRESLVDHLSATPMKVDDFVSGKPPSDAGFRTGNYSAVVHAPDTKKKGKKKGDEAAASGSVVLSRKEKVAALGGKELEIIKKISLDGASGYKAVYTLANHSNEPVNAYFAVEMNYNFLTGDAHDRYYGKDGVETIGKLGITEDLGHLSFLFLKDHWTNIYMGLRSSIPAQVLVHPVRTVSMSEAGFESVYQSSAVILQWPVSLAPHKTFEVMLTQETGKAHD